MNLQARKLVGLVHVSLLLTWSLVFLRLQGGSSEDLGPQQPDWPHHRQERQHHQAHHGADRHQDHRLKVSTGRFGSHNIGPCDILHEDAGCLPLTSFSRGD